MTAEQQLERSVLEGKERDELHAIAQALSVKTTTRTKKADMIDGILKATGVVVEDGGGRASGSPNGRADGAETADSPIVTTRRSSVRKTRAASAATTQRDNGSSNGTAEGSSNGTAEGSSNGTAEGSSNGTAEGSSNGTAEGSSNGTAEGSSKGTAEGSSNGTAEGSSKGTPADRPTRSALDVADPGDGGSAPGKRVYSRPAVFSFSPDDDVKAAAGAGSAGDTDATSTGDPDGTGSTGPGAGSGRSNASAGGAFDEGGQTSTDGGRSNQGGQNGQGQPGAQGNRQGNQNQGNRQNNQNQNNQNQGNRQNNQGNQNQGNRQNNQGNRQNNPSQGSGNDDVGNRRNNRRRRGRDRQGEGTERDLQGAGGQEQQYQGELIPVSGLLDLRDEGYGFLRCDGYLPSTKDVYVSISQARRFALRKGDYIEGASRPAGNTEKFPALLRIDTVSSLDPEVARNRPRFEDLTPLFPDERLHLEMPGEKENMTTRIVDLLSPIGKGQRGLIVSPPKAGKTTVMKHIAHSIEANNPGVHLMVLLVDERPEEVTDMRRSVKGEVVASTFDRPSDEHTAVAELAIERAKRLVEKGQDVIIILDGITRLARAYNLAQPATGRIMSGGVDSGALYPPKKFFGAARNIEEGGSLTILATALVETGSKMDEVIFEEFKGTGNMELRLDRRLAERRLYPAIDVNASSTRHEELLFDRSQLQQVWKLRRVLNALANDGSAAAGLELLMDKIRTTKSNDEFLAEIAKGPAAPS